MEAHFHSFFANTVAYSLKGVNPCCLSNISQLLLLKTRSGSYCHVVVQGQGRVEIGASRFNSAQTTDCQLIEAYIYDCKLIMSLICCWYTLLAAACLVLDEKCFDDVSRITQSILILFSLWCAENNSAREWKELNSPYSRHDFVKWRLRTEARTDDRACRTAQGQCSDSCRWKA